MCAHCIHSLAHDQNWSVCFFLDVSHFSHHLQQGGKRRWAGDGPTSDVVQDHLHWGTGELNNNSGITHCTFYVQYTSEYKDSWTNLPTIKDIQQNLVTVLHLDCVLVIDLDWLAFHSASLLIRPELDTQFLPHSLNAQCIVLQQNSSSNTHKTSICKPLNVYIYIYRNSQTE